MKKQDIIGIYKKARYFGPFIPFSHLFITFFESHLSEIFLKKIEEKRNHKIRKILHPFIKNVKYSDDIKTSRLEDIKTSSTIWLFWIQGESSLPPLSRLCIETIRKNSNGHSVILLTKKNLSQYVNISPIIYQLFEQGNIKPAHFADIIRINVLAQEGGFWLDATMLVTKSIPEDIFQREFWTIKIKEFGHYVSKCRWSVFTLASRKNNLLFVSLAKIFEEYFKKYPVMVDYFMFDQLINLLYEENPEIRKMIDEVPFNNPEVHALNPILGKPFHEKEWKSLTKDTFLFKLSNKTYPPSFHFSPNSFFSYISKTLLNNNPY